MIVMTLNTVGEKSIPPTITDRPSNSGFDESIIHKLNKLGCCVLKVASGQFPVNLFEDGPLVLILR